ncbi:MAG: glycosyltransferase family 2 protein [Sphingobacteriales bacterium]|nr:MAG: glycosyltransferase family 2 protein [Sphingobacteriales bacterium]
MLLSIVIVNYNTFDLTCQCVASIRQFLNRQDYEIIIVDNASPAEDPSRFREVYPDVKLVCNPENNGFAKGNNLGIRHSSGEYILLINSDAYLTSDCISPLLDQYTSGTITGPGSVRIVYPDGAFQHTARKFRSLRNELLDLARPLLYLMPYRQRARLMLNQYFKGDFNTEADWVSGAFMMIPAKLIRQLPGRQLDDRFFMYAEDELWCYQFRQLGHPGYFYAEASVVHIANASTEPGKQLSLLKTIIDHELVLMRLMYGIGFYYQVLRAVFLAKEYGRYYAKVFIWKLSGKKIR